MTRRFRQWGFGWAILGAVFVTSPLACSADDALTPTEQPAAIFSVQDDTFAALQTADVVYLGERHDSAADHAAQLEIIEALHAENPDLAIALEMFQRPFQPVIDRYLAGEITEAELVAQTEYLERWGFPWEFYAPFLRFAQANELPVLALERSPRKSPDKLRGKDWRAWKRKTFATFPPWPTSTPATTTIETLWPLPLGRTGRTATSISTTFLLPKSPGTKPWR
jgi:hypothetical protein